MFLAVFADRCKHVIRLAFAQVTLDQLLLQALEAMEHPTASPRPSYSPLSEAQAFPLLGQGARSKGANLAAFKLLAVAQLVRPGRNEGGHAPNEGALSGLLGERSAGVCQQVAQQISSLVLPPASCLTFSLPERCALKSPAKSPAVGE